jgi:hypothetical protein
MLCLDDPAEMTPEERDAELAAILATGFLRLKRQNTVLPDRPSAAPAPPEPIEKSSRNSLEPWAAPRLHGAGG